MNNHIRTSAASRLLLRWSTAQQEFRRTAVSTTSRSSTFHPLPTAVAATTTNQKRPLSTTSSSTRSPSTLQQQREQEGLALTNLPYIQPLEKDVPLLRRSDLQDESRRANQIFKNAQFHLEVVEARTHDLLKEAPIGSYTEADWRDAAELLLYWCQTGGSKSLKRKDKKVPSAAIAQSIPQSLDLLDRMVQEEQYVLAAECNKNEDIGKLADEIMSRSNWLGRIAFNWKQIDQKQAKILKGNNQSPKLTVEVVEPQTMLKALKELAEKSNSFQLNCSVYKSIMEVTIRRGVRTNKPQRHTRDYSKTAGNVAKYATPEMIETAEYIESLLGEMREANILPDRQCYANVIQAWEWACDGDRAQQCFQEMCDLYAQGKGSLQPTRHEFHTVLSAVARGSKSSQTLDKCYSIIDQMRAYHKTGGLDTLPGTSTFNTILTCLLHNPHVEDAKTRAETLFQEMGTTRDETSYNILLEMYSKRGMAEKAAALLKEMYKDFEKTNDRRIEPSTKSFNLVLSAWTKVGNSAAVEDLVGFMEELHASRVLRNVGPDKATYSIIIDNWVKQVGTVSDAAYRAENILHVMKRIARAGKPAIAPTTITYTSVINAFAKSGNASMAEKLLGEMMDDFLQHGNKDVRPDLTAFNSVLLALSRSNQHDSGNKIKAYMKRMENMSDSGVLGRGIYVRPDVRSYNTLVQAIAQSGNSRAGEDCETILETMMQNPHLQPNTVTFSNTIRAYARSGRAEEAERILEHVCDEYYKQSNGHNMKPSVALFSSVMTAWSNRGSIEAPARAQLLLDRMKELREAGDLLGTIDTIVYNALVDSWASSGRGDTLERIEAILQEMEDDRSEVSPDKVSYNTAMKAFAALGDTDGCQRIFDRMKEAPGIQPGVDTLCTLLTAWSRSPELTNTENPAERALAKLYELQESSGIAPNVACYNVVLNCLAEAQSQEACHVAENLLLEMERISAHEGNTDRGLASARPNTVSYTTLIQAFASVGDAEKAEMILERMIETYVRRGSNHDRLQPTARCFNSALKAWAKQAKMSSSHDAPARAEALLSRMRRLHKSAGAPVRPDVISYNIVIDCWKNSRLEGCSMRALSILNEMIGSEEDDGVKPNTISYNTVIASFAQNGTIAQVEALIQSMHKADNQKQVIGPSPVKPNLITYNSLMSACMKSRSPLALEKAESTLEKMYQLYTSGDLEAKPNTITFNCLMWCWATSNRNDAGERCQAILEEMWKAGEKELKPNLNSYQAAIRAWLTCNESEQAARLLLSACDEYERGDRAMRPSVALFRSILKALTDNGGDEIRQRMRQIHPYLVDLDVCAAPNTQEGEKE